MTRYHINPESQRPNICRAKIRCDFAVDGQEPPHFGTKQEARKYVEEELTTEYGATSSVSKAEKTEVAKPKAKKLTKAQKDRLEGAEHARNAVEKRGFDPAELLPYANSHNAWAKGHKEELERMIAERNSAQNDPKKDLDEKKADLKNLEMEWSAAEFADVPAIEEEMETVRREIDVLEEKVSGSKDSTKNNVSDSSTINKSSDGVERVSVDTTAMTIRAGDILHGEKFTESGKWVDNDAKVVKVAHTLDLDWKTRVELTYENGNVAEYTGAAKVTVKRDKNIKPDKTTKVINNEINKASRAISANGYLEQKEASQIIEALNNNNASVFSIRKAKKISDALEDNNQHDPSIKIDAAITRINLRYDPEHKLDSTDAFSLLYDKERTDPELVERLKKEFPQAAENAETNRKFRKQINDRDGLEWL